MWDPEWTLAAAAGDYERRPQTYSTLQVPNASARDGFVPLPRSFLLLSCFFLHTSFCVGIDDPFDPNFAPPFLPAQRSECHGSFRMDRAQIESPDTISDYYLVVLGPISPHTVLVISGNTSGNTEAWIESLTLWDYYSTCNVLHLQEAFSFLVINANSLCSLESISLCSSPLSMLYGGTHKDGR